MLANQTGPRRRLSDKRGRAEKAGLGDVDLGRLPEFIEARKRNWLRLRRGLDPLSHLFRFCLPTHATPARWSSTSTVPCFP